MDVGARWICRRLGFHGACFPTLPSVATNLSDVAVDRNGHIRRHTKAVSARVQATAVVRFRFRNPRQRPQTVDVIATSRFT